MVKRYDLIVFFKIYTLFQMQHLIIEELAAHDLVAVQPNFYICIVSRIILCNLLNLLYLVPRFIPLFCLAGQSFWAVHEALFWSSSAH